MYTSPLTGDAMHHTVRSMTLRDLLNRHGITTIRDFAQRAGLSRQHAWNLWHAQVGVGTEMLKRLHTRLGIPLEELIGVEPVPAVKRPRATTRAPAHARPRKSARGRPPAPPEEAP
jgi:transcriptional regulator with XRE-family HTH domain